MENYLASSLAQRRFTLTLLALFSGPALAAVGIYGVVPCAVTSRAREMGIRMALGAERRDVLAMVLRQAAVLAGAGLAEGLAASLALTRLLRACCSKCELRMWRLSPRWLRCWLRLVWRPAICRRGARPVWIRRLRCATSERYSISSIFARCPWAEAMRVSRVTRGDSRASASATYAAS